MDRKMRECLDKNICFRVVFCFLAHILQSKIAGFCRNIWNSISSPIGMYDNTVDPPPPPIPQATKSLCETTTIDNLPISVFHQLHYSTMMAEVVLLVSHPPPPTTTTTTPTTHHCRNSSNNSRRSRPSTKPNLLGKNGHGRRLSTHSTLPFPYTTTTTTPLSSSVTHTHTHTQNTCFSVFL